MSKSVVVRLTDDLDGGQADEELTFALRGIEYRIDLSAKNAAALEKALEKYIAAGSRVTRVRGARSSAKQPRLTAKNTKEDLGAIREWARASGYAVSTRGRISGEIKAAYEAAE